MYAKLFSSIYKGTLRGNSHGLLVFTNLLANADASGFADIHPRVIAEEVGLSLEQVNAALLVLEAPDPESRSHEEEGRRIVRMDGHRAWGWKIVNHAKYRAIRNEEDRRDQNRKSQAAWRERQVEKEVSRVSHGKPKQKQEAEAETKEEKQKISPSAHPPAAGRFQEFWELWPKTDRKQDKKKCAEKWAKLKLDDIAETILSHVRAMKQTRKWLDGYDPLPMTYLNGARWQDEIPPDRQSQETAYEASMRSKYEQVSPMIAKRAPEAVKPNPMDVLDAIIQDTKRIAG